MNKTQIKLDRSINIERLEATVENCDLPVKLYRGLAGAAEGTEVAVKMGRWLTVEREMELGGLVRGSLMTASAYPKWDRVLELSSPLVPKSIILNQQEEEEEERRNDCCK